MKYTGKSLKYVFANFGYLILFGLFPAVFLAYSLDSATVGRILGDFFSGEPRAKFSEIFRAVSIFNFRSPTAVLAEGLGVALTVVCVAMMMAFMEKHMRIGKKTWNGLFSKVNDNLLSTLGITLLFTALYELWALIVSALLFCVTYISSRFMTYVAAAIVFFGTEIVLLYVVSVFYLWLPCLQITGFRSFEALRYSYQLVAPVKWKIVWEQFLSMVIAETVLSVASVLIPSNTAVFILAAVVFAFLILLFVTRMQVAYFDCAQMDRADLKPYYTD